jgi:hypothetical protein
MGATVEFPNGVRARVDDGEWSCPDPRALELIVGLVDLYQPDGYVPDADLALAQFVADMFRGRVVEQDPPPTDVPDFVRD